MTNETPRTIREMIEPEIMKRGGWVNTHAHADRAFTLSPEILEMRRTIISGKSQTRSWKNLLGI